MKLPRMLDQSIATQAALLIGVVVGIPLVGVTVGSAVLLRDQAIENAERLLVTEVEGVAARIDAVHHGHVRAATLLSTVPRTHAYCAALGADRALLQEEMVAQLAAFVSTGDDLNAAVVFSPEGIVWASTVEGSEDIDVSFRDYFQKAMEGRAVISDVFQPLPLGGTELMVAYVAPVLAGTEVQCVVGLMGHPNGVGAILDESDGFGGERSFIVLFDQYGIRIGSSLRKDFVLRPSGPIPAPAAATMVAQGRFGPETATLLADVVPNPALFELASAAELPADLAPFWEIDPANGEVNFSIARRLRTVPQTVVARIPKSALFAPSAVVVWRVGAIGAAALILAVVLGFVVARVRSRT